MLCYELSKLLQVTFAGKTPSVRDKLNINPEEGLEIANTPAAHKMYQNSLKEQLKRGLSGLPQPKNDYEIVVPEHDEEEIPEEAQAQSVSWLQYMTRRSFEILKSPINVQFERDHHNIYQGFSNLLRRLKRRSLS